MQEVTKMSRLQRRIFRAYKYLPAIADGWVAEEEVAVDWFEEYTALLDDIAEGQAQLPASPTVQQQQTTSNATEWFPQGCINPLTQAQIAALPPSGPPPDRPLPSLPQLLAAPSLPRIPTPPLPSLRTPPLPPSTPSSSADEPLSVCVENADDLHVAQYTALQCVIDKGGLIFIADLPAPASRIEVAAGNVRRALIKVASRVSIR
jgi:hypothetical protein